MIDEGPDNQDRADRVSSFVIQSAVDRYWGNEYIETVVSDIITDLFHFLDRADEYIGHLPHMHRDPDTPEHHRMASWAVDRYVEEVDEEHWTENEEALPVL